MYKNIEITTNLFWLEPQYIFMYLLHLIKNLSYYELPLIALPKPADYCKEQLWIQAWRVRSQSRQKGLDKE